MADKDVYELLDKYYKKLIGVTLEVEGHLLIVMQGLKDSKDEIKDLKEKGLIMFLCLSIVITGYIAYSIGISK